MKNVFYRALKGTVAAVFPKYTLEGTENIPDGACVIVGNHAQINGPILSQVALPGENYTWCAGEMFHMKEVPAYAREDFWSEKPKWQKPFFHVASYVIAPLSVFVFNNADTVPVYRDARVMSTMKDSARKLESGAHVVIFPEGHETPEKGNHVIAGFQQGFESIARIYSKRTGKELAFVPMYVAPSLRKACFGEPVYSCKENDKATEQQRIIGTLMERITALAMELPPHVITPYENIPKKDYPVSR